MSLLLSPVPKNPKYIFPSSGDIDFDPDLTRDSFSFLNETDHSQEQLKDLTKVLPEDLQALEAFTPELSPQPSVVIQRKQYTTQEKILQVQNGQYISNSLKGNRSFPQEILQTAENIKQSIQENYKKNDDGSLEMINEVQLKKQKKVLGFLAKQFGSALFTGKPIVSVSLPVTIFEPQSNLEREASGLGYAPYYLEKGGNTTDTLEQFRLAATQFIASLHLGTNPQKPFNPILGETFQGKIGDSPVYLEQISHHPPASALQMLGKNFTLEGMTEFSAAISMNSVKSWKVGYLKVNYKNTGAVVRAQYPPGLMNGTAFGKRTFQFTDKFYIFDIENKYYTEISFDGNESSLFKRKYKGSKDQFSGAIWKINDIFAEKLRQATKQQNEIAEIKFKEREHSVARLGNIEGSWLESLKIDGQVYWSFGSVLPYKLQYLENPLPSDSNFRLDVLYMRAEDEVKSQTYKEILEENQRNDRKLREHNRKRHLK